MATIMEIGKPISKCCITCEYWLGSRSELIFCATLNVPGRMKLTDAGYKERGICTKKKCMRAAKNTCSQHEFYYDFKKYLKQG